MLCKKQSNSTNFKLATGNSGGSSVDNILGFIYLSAKKVQFKFKQCNQQKYY